MAKPPKIRTLYELTKNKLFDKGYLCIYCNMRDSDKSWLQTHIKNIHDEFGKVTTIFNCRLCNKITITTEIMNHIFENHI